jgi:lysophospholipase L1-like esterase
MSQFVAEKNAAMDRKLPRLDLVRLPFISLLTIFVLLAASEVAARVDDKILYGAPLWSNYNLDTLYTFDQYGRRGKPYAHYLKWQLNEEGYRGPALRSNTYRIVCLGSSETFGLYEQNGNEWPRVLERELDQQSANKKFEVVNAAYPGMSVPSILRRAPYTEQTLHPQLAVIYPSFTSYIEDDNSAPAPIQAPPESHHHVELRIASIIQTGLKSHLPEKVQTWMREKEIERAEKSHPAMTSVPQPLVDKFQSDLDQLVRALQQGNTKVILVTHATRFSDPLTVEDRNYLIMWRRFYPQLSEGALIDMERRMNQALRDVGAREGVPVVDAEKQIPPGGQNFQEFSHFTDHGANELATLVEKEVLRQAK